MTTISPVELKQILTTILNNQAKIDKRLTDLEEAATTPTLELDHPELDSIMANLHASAYTVEAPDDDYHRLVDVPWIEKYFDLDKHPGYRSALGVRLSNLSRQHKYEFIDDNTGHRRYHTVILNMFKNKLKYSNKYLAQYRRTTEPV